MFMRFDTADNIGHYEDAVTLGLPRSDEDAMESQSAESPVHQKKFLFRYRFHFLLLISVIFMVSYYNMSSNSLKWWESFPIHVQYFRNISRPRPKFQNPGFRIPLKQNTEIPAVVYHLAYPRNYHFIMEDTVPCTDKTFLVLVVPVAPGNLLARNAIRKTWGNETVVQGEKVKTVFLLGLPGGTDVQQQQEKLKEENLLYHDLIQSSFQDSYLNLTIKTMVIMDWLATRCPQVDYAMKIDSDMFLNIDNLVIMLKSPEIPKENYLTGMLMWDRPVIRSKNSKWYVSEEMYPEPLYPTYTLGMGYIFSIDLPAKFVEISKIIKPFNIEDAYIGMCMKKLGLSPTQPPNPWQFKAYNTAYNRCEYSKVITYILGSAEQLVNYWTDLKKPGPPC